MTMTDTPEALTDELKEQVRMAKQLPEPVGYKILCAVPKAEEKIEGSSLLKAKQTIENEEALAVSLFVVSMGPDCYKDERRYPNGPWCKPGDFIIVRPHVGSKLKIHGQEFRIINDDTVECVVEDPRGIKRA
jgi:co-chaperonin GroES (HSP10)